MKAGIIYVSSNREDPEFERRTLEDLIKKAGNVPIVSVTQKPIHIWNNFCIGDVGASGFNFCRQVLIACEHSDADYVISAESDCLYSPDYFQFIPQRLDVPYRNTNIYVQKYKEDYCCKKTMSTFSQVVGREFYIQRLSELFEGLPMWSMDYKNFPKETDKNLFDEFEHFETEYPCLSFKTGKGMRKHSNTDELPVYDLPYWGNIKKLKEEYAVK